MSQTGLLSLTKERTFITFCRKTPAHVWVDWISSCTTKEWRKKNKVSVLTLTQNEGCGRTWGKQFMCRIPPTLQSWSCSAEGMGQDSHRLVCMTDQQLLETFRYVLMLCKGGHRRYWKEKLAHFCYLQREIISSNKFMGNLHFCLICPLFLSVGYIHLRGKNVKYEFLKLANTAVNVLWIKETYAFMLWILFL